MKLTEDLKKKMGGASEEEVKTILAETKKNVENAGIILDDAELDQVAAGLANFQAKKNPDFVSRTY